MIKISVIIPVFNEEKEILDCIESLGRQSYEDFEIIIVDDGSTDSTNSEVYNLTHIISSLTVLKQNHKGPGAARNLGAKSSEGGILVFVDADMTFDKNFIKFLVKPIQEGKTKGTFSKEEYVENWQNSWSRCWNINEGWPEKRRHPSDYPDKQKVFRAILKSEFDRIGGFNPGGYTDDYTLYQKLGYMADNAPGAIFFHKNPSSAGEVFRQARWTGKRAYKLGILGFIVALGRSSLPFSLIIGIYKSFLHLNPLFVIFKVIYDFGVFSGILSYIVFKNYAK